MCTLGRRLRDIIEEQNTEGHEETLKTLGYLREIPNPLCGFDYVTERQLWRLLDLRDGATAEVMLVDRRSNWRTESMQLFKMFE